MAGVLSTRWARLRWRAGRLVMRAVPSLRRTLRQMTDYAVAWTAANDRALARAEDGSPVWAVLGDSTAQGVGATSWDTGYVGRLLPLLRDRDGRDWRVVNLSRSGATVADVVAEQLPALAALPLTPDLVTAVVGGNDLRRTPTAALLADLRALVQLLPAGALVATLPQGLRATRAQAANELLRSMAPARGLLLADLWAVTGPPWRGRFADGFHPNAVGLTPWVAALATALGLPPEADPPG